jgi:hypothetical protein
MVALSRKHTLGPWAVAKGLLQDRDGRDHNLATAVCTDCGRKVAVDTHPQHETAPVTGEALETDCDVLRLVR